MLMVDHGSPLARMVYFSSSPIFRLRGPLTSSQYFSIMQSETNKRIMISLQLSALRAAVVHKEGGLERRDKKDGA